MGGILLRNHNHKKIINHSEIWFSHICKYTRRDQLSLLHSAHQANIKIDGYHLDIRKSKYHNWPIESKKRNRQLKDIEFDLISHKFAQKNEKLIFQLELEKEDLNKLFPRLKLIKTIIFNVKSFVKYLLRKIINFLFNKNDIPLFGICRGMQMMALYLGSNLKKVEGHVKKRHKLKGEIDFEVNSFHNFGIKKNNLSKKFVKIAFDKEKNIEMFVSKKHKIIGVMWHPEREDNKKILTDLIKKLTKK